MTADEARFYIKKFGRLALMQTRIGLVEDETKCRLWDIFPDNDLITIFVERLKERFER